MKLGMAVSLLLASLALPAQEFVTQEYRAKASYLAKFPSFIEWPEPALPPGDAPFLLRVFGDFPFGLSLADSTRGGSIHQRRIVPRWIRKEQDLLTCHVLFVSQSEQKRYRRVLEIVSAQQILTVEKTPDFLDAGGILCFSMEKEILWFEVNLDEANRAHLKISSRLLALARRVVTHTEAAKS